MTIPNRRELRPIEELANELYQEGHALTFYQPHRHGEFLLKLYRWLQDDIAAGRVA